MRFPIAVPVSPRPGRCGSALGAPLARAPLRVAGEQRERVGKLCGWAAIAEDAATVGQPAACRVSRNAGPCRRSISSPVEQVPQTARLPHSTNRSEQRGDAAA